MADTPKTSVVISHFPGLVTWTDAQDLPEGASNYQINAVATRPTELNVRRGYKVVSFES